MKTRRGSAIVVGLLWVLAVVAPASGQDDRQTVTMAMRDVDLS